MSNESLRAEVEMPIEKDHVTREVFPPFEYAVPDMGASTAKFSGGGLFERLTDGFRQGFNNPEETGVAGRVGVALARIFKGLVISGLVAATVHHFGTGWDIVTGIAAAMLIVRMLSRLF